MTDEGLARILALHHLLQECSIPIHYILLKGLRSAHYISENHDKVKPEMNLKELLLQINSEVKMLRGKRNFPEISNIAENGGPLSEVLVKDLSSEDESRCEALRRLDLNFVLNILLHRLLNIDLSSNLSTAIEKIKKIRQLVCHAGSNFTQVQFETQLNDLFGQLLVLYQNLKWSEKSLKAKKSIIIKEAESKNTPTICNELRQEVHQQYTSHHTIPIITQDTLSGSPVVVEDLLKFVEDQQFHHPIVICGHHDADMAHLLAHIANSLGNGNSRAFSLVLLLEDPVGGSAPGGMQKNCPTVEEIWPWVYHCLQSLAPCTWVKYGSEAVKTVLNVYKQETLFLVGWKMKVSGPMRSKMDEGTWVLAQREVPAQVLEWTVLRIHGFTEHQVEKFLESSVSEANMKEVLSLYQNCHFKSAISSVELIMAFGKMTSRSCLGTYWEFCEEFIHQKLQSLYHGKSKPVLHLGKVAFQTACKNNNFILVQELKRIPMDLCKMFLEVVANGNRAFFFHAVARDYLIANYVASDPSTACKKWLASPEQFRNIFCFTCFLWSKKRRLMDDNLTYIEQFLFVALQAPPKESNGMQKHRGDHSSHSQKMFNNWGYLLEVDKASTGQKIVRKKLAGALARFPVWVFSEDLTLDDSELSSLEKIIKLVNLHGLAVTIKIDSRDVRLLTCIWEMLRHTEELQYCAEVIMVVKHTEASVMDSSQMEELIHCIVDERRVFITHYIGPLFCQDEFYLLKCPCMKYLSELDVTVYDVQSMKEALSCEGHRTLQDVRVKVNLKKSKQEFPSTLTIKIPGNVKLHLTIRYFENIEKLFKCFEQETNVTSLSITDVIVSHNFSLDISVFENLNSFNLKFESLDHETMEVESGNVMSHNHPHHRSDWMMSLVNGMKLPVNLERLLLRSMDFCCDCNQHFLKILQHRPHDLSRLVVLDCMLTISGARKLVRKEDEEELMSRTKRICVDSEASEVKKLVEKNPRLSKERRLKLQQNKPSGKEFIVESEVSSCSNCQVFPCCCPPKEGEDIRDTLDQLSDLIVDIYSYNILTFSYTSNVCAVRKNVCGDLSISCMVSDLTDTNAAKLHTSYGDPLHGLFLRLVLAQAITFTGTKLSSKGVEEVIKHLQDVKKKYGPGQKGPVQYKDGVEPFNLTVETSWQPSPELKKCLGCLANLVCSLPCISVFNLRCGDKNRRLTLKKTFRGVLLLNGKENHKLRDSV